MKHPFELYILHLDKERLHNQAKLRPPVSLDHSLQVTYEIGMYPSRAIVLCRNDNDHVLNHPAPAYLCAFCTSDVLET